MRKIFMLMVVGVMLLTVPAWGRVYISAPVIGQWTSTTRAVERGALFYVNVCYNSSDVVPSANVVAAEIYLQFNKTYVTYDHWDEVGGSAWPSTRAGTAIGPLAGADDDIFAYSKYALSGGLAPTGSEQVIYRVWFRMKNDAPATGVAVSQLINFCWNPPYSNDTNYLVFSASGGADKTGTRDRANDMFVGEGKKPGSPDKPIGGTGETAGFHGVQGVVSTGNGVANVGNTLTVNWGAINRDWDSNVGPAGVRTQTRYADGYYQYTVYRGAVGFGLPGTLVADGLGGGGQDTYQNGPGTGIPGSGTATLSDCELYEYIIRSRDGTLNHNQDENMRRFSQKPHDYVAPAFSGGLGVLGGDGTIRLTWNNTAPDRAGYAILRTLDSTVYRSGAVLFEGAGRGGDLDSDGVEPPTEGSTVSGWQVIKRLGPGESSFDDTGLTNGVSYYYRVYAWDVAETVSAIRQQGKNYTFINNIGVPGVNPAPVANFVALSGPDRAGLTLKWKYPTDADPNLVSNSVGGAQIAWTTDVNAWAGLAFDAANTDPAANVAVAAGGPAEAQIAINSLGAAPLTEGTIYYFKVFSHNRTADPAARLPSLSGALAGAWPGGAGGGGPVTYYFRRATDGLGLNAFAILHDLPLTVRGGAPGATPTDYTTPVNTIAELTAAINAVSGTNNVTAIGWLGTNSQLEGYYVTYDPSGAPTFTPTAGLGTAAASGISPTRSRVFQVSVIRDVDVTLSGR